ncbi:MAG: hypothetical protein P8Z76_19830, partial [Alphaproteobacteria bacterium]
LRYDIGDVAEWGEPCDCGMTLPVIKRLWGRQRHFITHPDGRTSYVKLFLNRDFQESWNVDEIDWGRSLKKEGFAVSDSPPSATLPREDAS